MKPVWRILITYLLLTLLFVGLLTAAHCIPRSAIEDHVRLSVNQMNTDKKSSSVKIGFWEPYQLGYFTEYLMLDIAYCVDTKAPLQSAMSAIFMMKEGSPGDGITHVLQDTDDTNLQPVVYCRYWHGNQTLLRPLLCVTTVHGIHIINIVLLALLVLALCLLLWKRVGGAAALIITLSLAAVMIPSVPLCMNYVPTFFIALIASIVILTCKRLTATPGNTILFFFVVGALTTFFDLLTTPILAMGVPLVVYMLYRRPEHKWRIVITISLAWLAGYASLWATKWLLVAVIGGQDAFKDAFGAVTQRTVGHDEQGYMLWCLKKTCELFLAIGGITAIVTLFFGKSWASLKSHSWLLLVALSSVVWCFVLLEHTWHHLHFTWRTLVVLIIGILLYWHHTLDLKHPLSLFAKQT